jgi:hypothetical protein
MTNDQRDLPSGDGDRFGNTPTAKLVVFVALAAAALIFVLQNRERKSVDFLFLEINSRQWVNIVVAILIGVVLDRLFLGWWRRRGQRD